MGRPLVYLSVPTVRLVDRQRETPLRGVHSSRFRPGIIGGLEPPTAMRVFADVKIMRDVKRIASGSMLITATCLGNLHTRCKLSRQVWRAPLPWGRATDLVLFPLLISSPLMSLNLIDALPLSYPAIGEIGLWLESGCRARSRTWNIRFSLYSDVTQLSGGLQVQLGSQYANDAV